MNNQNHSYQPYYIVFFKRLGSRHIHKEIKLPKGTKGVDKILCKTDSQHIQTLAYR